jgi:hypothetical protein
VAVTLKLRPALFLVEVTPKSTELVVSGLPILALAAEPSFLDAAPKFAARLQIERSARRFGFLSAPRKKLPARSTAVRKFAKKFLTLSAELFASHAQSKYLARQQLTYVSQELV